MYAVIQAGGKQYRIAPGDKVRIESMTAEPGAAVELTGLVTVTDNDGRVLSGNDLANAKVTATVAKHGRGEKLIVFKFKRKKQYKRLYGHRQNYTELTVTDVVI